MPRHAAVLPRLTAAEVNTPANSAIGSWQILEITDAKSEAGATLAPLEDGSLLAGGKTADKDTYTLVARTRQTGVRGVRLEALVDDSLLEARTGPRRERQFRALSDVEITAAPEGSAITRPCR